MTDTSDPAATRAAGTDRPDRGAAPAETLPDSQHEHGHAIAESEALPLPALLVRSGVGGVLMGLANLVPGISGGTMLLAAGVYPTFISSIAELTTLKIRLRPVLALGAIGGAAAIAILLLAGTMRGLVVDQRWIMYSLFIGLTLGGVPLVWRLARPATSGVYVGAAVAFALMATMALTGEASRDGDSSTVLLGVAGLAGASAMILPGVSGGYLLLLLGQYEPILGAIDGLKQGLLGDGGTSLALVRESLTVLVPVGIGVAAGIVGVSNLVRWLLDRFEKPTLGALLGLLLGSVVGLYPFQEPVPPAAGAVHRGQVLSAEEAATLAPKYWPLERFTPGAGQAGGALVLVLAGFAATWLVDRIGGDHKDEPGAARGARPCVAADPVDEPRGGEPGQHETSAAGQKRKRPSSPLGGPPRLARAGDVQRRSSRRRKRSGHLGALARGGSVRRRRTDLAPISGRLEPAMPRTPVQGLYFMLGFLLALYVLLPFLGVKV